MTFLQIRQRIAELMGLSATDTTPDANGVMQDKLKAWVNNRYKALAAKRSWNWLVKDSIVQTTPDVTTGTVTATNGSTALIFSNAILPADVQGYFVQIQDTTDWYEVVSASDTSNAVMDVPFLGLTSGTYTFTLRKFYYLLPADTGKILDVSQHRIWNTALKFIPARILDQYLTYRQQTNRPRYYTIIGINSTRQYKMELFPYPNVAMNLNVRRYQVITEMTADTDIPVLPEAYHEILVWAVLSTYGYTFLDDTRIASAKAEFNTLYQDMIHNDVATENIPVRLAFDVDLSGFNNVLGQYNLPVQP